MKSLGWNPNETESEITEDEKLEFQKQVYKIQTLINHYSLLALPASLWLSRLALWSYLVTWLIQALCFAFAFMVVLLPWALRSHSQLLHSLGLCALIPFSLLLRILCFALTLTSQNCLKCIKMP